MKTWIFLSILFLLLVFVVYIASSLLCGKNPHTYLNWSHQFYNQSLFLAEWCVKRGIRVNTLDNVRQANPGMSEPSAKHRQTMESGWLYGQYAWILWKKNQSEEALQAIRKAVEYKFKLDAEDHFRLGVIEYYNGEKQQGWENVTQALLMDSKIENRDPDYLAAITEMIQEKHGAEQEPVAFISEYRKNHAETVPNLSLVTLEGDSISLDQKRGKVLFLNFFSPACGSCRMEISNLGELYQRFAPRDEVEFLFVLNQPRLRERVPGLFEQNGLPDPPIVVLESGSAYDLIPAEPSTWIVDKTGTVIAKFIGFQPGDELVYQQKLTELAGN
jgi:thiol-disulfide isomerase/thioredoxin